jgi:Ca2+/Na+ antiporter
VSETSLDKQGKILAFAAVVEVATGLVLMIDPAVVVALLVGMEVSGVGTLLGRCFGIALLALGLACWPAPQRVDSGGPKLRGMLVYNALLALYLAFLGTVRHVEGMLLWPAVALHAVVALLVLWTWRSGRLTKVTVK